MSLGILTSSSSIASTVRVRIFLPQPSGLVALPDWQATKTFITCPNVRFPTSVSGNGGCINRLVVVLERHALVTYRECPVLALVHQEIQASCLLDLLHHSIFSAKQYRYYGRGVSSKQRMYESAREHFQVEESYRQGHITT